MKLTIIGFGAFGKAIASIVKINANVELCAWDIADSGDQCQVSDISKAIIGADAVFFAVPSAFFADCLKGISAMPEDAILISGTKGIDQNSGKLPFELLSEAFPENQIAVLSGPMLAQEIGNGTKICATLAASNRKTFATVSALFENTLLELCYSKDMLGVSLAGVLKNVYTLALGLSDGLSLGSNFKSCLALQAIKEIQAVIQVLGGDTQTIMTHAGLGDFLATGYSESSRNYQFGFSVGQGKKSEKKETVEGVDNIATILLKLLDKNSFPLICAIEDIFLKEVEPKERLLQALRSC